MPVIEMLQSSPLDIFYFSLFHPIRTFQGIARQEMPSNRLLIIGAVIVFIISALAPVIHCILKGGAIENLILMLPFSAIAGIFLWLVMGGIIAMIAFAFTCEPRYKMFLTLSALATAPWLLMPSLALVKINLGVFGDVLGTILGYLLWGWSVYLFAAAIGTTYRITPDRVLIVLLLPFIFVWVAFFWAMGFIGNLYLLAP